jgi:hypothetical protein
MILLRSLTTPCLGDNRKLVTASFNFDFASNKHLHLHRYPNPYMSDRLGTTGPLLIQSTNLVSNFIVKSVDLPKYNPISDRATGSLCP